MEKGGRAGTGLQGLYCSNKQATIGFGGDWSCFRYLHDSRDASEYRDASDIQF